MMDFIKKKKTVLISILYVTFIYVLIGITLKFHFSAADDFWMARIFSGRMTGIPEMMPKNTGMVFSALISGLYKLNNHVGWFTVLQIFLLWLSGTVICFCMLNETKKLPKLGILIGFGAFTLTFGSLLMYFSVNMTYSITPAACAAAVFLMTLTDKSEWTGCGKRFSAVLTVFLLFFSLIMREKTAYVAMVVYMGTLFVAVTAFEMKINEAYKRALLPVVVMVVVVVATQFFPVSDDWKSAIELEYARAGWVDYDHVSYKDYEKEYNSLGWTEAEFNMAEVYMMLDDDFNTENFEVLNKLAKDNRDSIFSRVAKSLRYIFTDSGVDKYLVAAALVLAGTAGMFCFFGGNKRMLFAPVCYFAGFIVLFLYIVSLGRFLKHAVSVVYIVALVPLFFTTVKIAADNYSLSVKPGKILKILALAACVLITAATTYSEYNTTKDMANKEWRIMESEYISAVDSYAADNPGNAYFFLPLACDYGEPEAFYADLTGHTNSLCTEGWVVQTPAFEKQLQVNGFDKMERSLFFKDNVYMVYGTNFLIESGEYYMGLVMDYIKDEYPNADYIVVEEKDNYNICKIINN